MSDRVLRDRAFSVAGGAVRKARRVDGRDDLREIHVEPTGHGDISISLPATTDCGASDAICTADGRPLDDPRYPTRWPVRWASQRSTHAVTVVPSSCVTV